jgi:hypothetical protein
MRFPPRISITVRIVDDRARQNPSLGHPNTEAEPPENNQDNPAPPVTPINDPEDTDHNRHGPNEERPYWRERLQSIYEHFPKADFWLALFTLFLVIETAMTISILSTSDQALNKSADAANAANKLNTGGLRPWISTFSAIGSGLTLDDNGAHITIDSHISNIGRSPARDLSAHVELFPSHSLDETRTRRDNQCNEAHKVSGSNITGAGFFLFPNESFKWTAFLLMPPPEVAEWKSAAKGSLIPIIAGCVDYQFVFSGEHHTTKFVYELDKRGPPERPWITIDPNAGDIPGIDLELSRNQTMPWDAD